MKRDLWEAQHTCTHCYLAMEKTTFTIDGFTIRGWECSRCQESVLHTEDAQKMLTFNKLKQGLSIKVGELGNSLILRVPKEVAAFYHIDKGEEVILKAEDNSNFKIEVVV